MSRHGRGPGRTTGSKNTTASSQEALNQIIEHKFFIKDFICRSMSEYVKGLDRPIRLEQLESCDRIILPPASLEHLSKFSVANPIMMKVSANGKHMYVGVRDFTSEHQVACVPSWIMNCLGVAEGKRITVKSVELPKATYIKFKPVTPLFSKLTNPRIVLEIHLQNFTTLCLNEVITVTYCEIPFEIKIVELSPCDAVSLTDADVKIDID